jgi:hypothetical protein
MPGTVNEMIHAALLRHKSNSEIQDSIRKAHPYSKVSIPTINFFRNQLRKSGKKILSDRECRHRKA